MPKGGKKKKGKKIVETQGDVTVNDYADSSQAKGRVKKPVLNSLVREVKQVCKDPNEAWDEKDDEVPEAWDEVEDSYPSSRRQGKKRQQKDDTRDIPDMHYPIEVWFLLAKYIRPEDVKSFAAICRSTYYVVLRRCFWIRMYRRYHKPCLKLPLYLQPQCIVTSQFLRVAVVRALYHMYPPFAERKVKPSTILPKETYKLKRSRCVSVWHVQQDGKWNFYFKFSMPHCDSSPLSSDFRSLSACDKRCVVAKNPEEDCCIVCVTSPHFKYFPPTVMGCHLIDIRTTMGHDVRHHKIQMVFGSSCSKRLAPNYASLENGDYGGVLDFDPVESITILHWWQPEYPIDEYKIL